MGSHRTYRASAIIRASEIGQYVFCSMAWQLQQKGYIPDSSEIEHGANAHRSLGYTLDSFDQSLQVSRLCWKIALLCFSIGTVVLLGWVYL
jgi:hypothetical protein